MKLFLILFLVPLVSTAEILIPEGGGESTAVYNDAGWDISNNSQAFTVATRCQGDMCPQVVFQRMRFTSMKTFDFIATKTQMSAYEIVYRLGFSQENDAKSFNAARLIVDEIKESLLRRESKETFATRQMGYIVSSEERSLRLLKAQIMAQLADRIRP